MTSPIAPPPPAIPHPSSPPADALFDQPRQFTVKRTGPARRAPLHPVNAVAIGKARRRNAYLASPFAGAAPPSPKPNIEPSATPLGSPRQSDEMIFKLDLNTPPSSPQRPVAPKLSEQNQLRSPIRRLIADKAARERRRQADEELQQSMLIQRNHQLHPAR